MTLRIHALLHVDFEDLGFTNLGFENNNAWLAAMLDALADNQSHANREQYDK